MSYHLFFLVMNPDTMALDTPVSPVQTLKHYSDQRSFISQFVDIGWGEPVIETHAVPEGFILDRLPYDGRDVEPGCINPQGEPLRYFYAGDISWIGCVTGAHNFDEAMMAYLHALDPKTPIIPVWYF